MTAATYETLFVRYRVRARLRAISPVRIAAAMDLDVASSDRPVVRDARHRPYLPGSTLKGGLRSGAEAMLSVFGPTAACDPVEGPTCTAAVRGTATRDAIDNALCRTCALFGSSHFAGRLSVFDAPVDEATGARTETRSGTAVDRDYETARGGIHEVEVVVPGSAFAFEAILENPTDADVALVAELLDRATRGDIRFGAGAGHGFGRLAVDTPSLARIDAAGLLGGRDYETVPWPTEETRRPVLEAAFAGSSPSEER